MRIQRPGLSLFVEHYPECVAFYRDALGLPVQQVKETLTTFAFGDGYLMVEQGGVSYSQEKTRQQNPAVLRFDVPDLVAAVTELRSAGVPVDHLRFDWGEIGVFVDPDGNRCEFKQVR
jgi:lactoylglutathione lyase